MTVKEQIRQAFEDANFNVQSKGVADGYSAEVLIVKNEDGRTAVVMDFDVNGNLMNIEPFGIPSGF